MSNAEKILKLVIKRTRDYDYEEVYDEYHDYTLYSVYDLSLCPEDAIIGRALFSGKDYINALKLGMSIAKEGFTDIQEVEENER